MLSYNDMWATLNRWHVETRGTRLRNLALLVHRIICSRSGCVSVVARHWPHGPRRHTHRLKRLHRFLKNHAVKETPVFES